jgi:large subunit ribosomal protein L25
MQRMEMTAQVRQQAGKGAARQVRRDGRVPAVLYGAKASPLVLSLDPHRLRAALAAGANTLIDLKVEGDGAAAAKIVMVKDYQVDPVKRTMVHADLYEIRMDQAITVEIPIRLTGKAEGVKSGGILEQVRRTVQAECLPDRIPDAIEVDVASLTIGQSIHAGDVTLPEGVKLKSAAGDTIVVVVAPQAEVVPTPEEQEAALKASLAAPEAAAGAAPAAGATKGAPGAAPAAGAKGAPGAAPAAGAKGGAAPAGGGKK